MRERREPNVQLHVPTDLQKEFDPVYIKPQSKQIMLGLVLEINFGSFKLSMQVWYSGMMIHFCISSNLCKQPSKNGAKVWLVNNKSWS